MMMSIISSLFIFCFCLYLSSHACNARRLEVIGNGGFGRQLVSSSKEAEKVKLNMDSTKKGAEKKGDSSIGDYHSSHGGGGAVVVTQKPKESKAFEKEMKKYTEDAISSGSIPIKPLVSVSNWHLPHNHKNVDEHPGFHSDYSRPRTRPPSHN